MRLTTERVGRGHDRLVAQPTGRGPAPTGTVLGRDVPSSIQIGIEIKSTLPTLELALRTAVGAGGMPAAATSLRGMSRVYRNHRTTLFFGLVLYFALRLANGHECILRFVCVRRFAFIRLRMSLRFSSTIIPPGSAD